MVNGKWVTETDVNYKNDKSQTGDWGNEYGKFVDGKWVTKTDVNYKNDKSQTGDWGNEYGPSKEVSAVKKKNEPMPNVGT